MPFYHFCIQQQQLHLGDRLVPVHIKVLEEIVVLFQLLKQVTTNLSEYLNILLLSVKKCQDAIFLFRISFLVAYMDIQQAIGYRFDRTLLGRLYLRGHKYILSSDDSRLTTTLLQQLTFRTMLDILHTVLANYSYYFFILRSFFIQFIYSEYCLITLYINRKLSWFRIERQIKEMNFKNGSQKLLIFYLIILFYHYFYLQIQLKDQLMLSDGRQDQLLKKLQQCVGRIQPKNYETNTKKETTLMNATDRRKSFDHRSILKGQDKMKQNHLNRTKKENQYERGSKYGTQKRRQRQLPVQKWQPRKKTDNYLKEGQNSGRKLSNYDNCYSNKKNYDHRIEFEHREALGNINSSLNIQKNSLNSFKYDRVQKPSYQNYKSYKNNQKQYSYNSIKPSQFEETYKHKEPELADKNYEKVALKVNYNQSADFGFDKRDHSKAFESLQRSRKEIIERKQIKKQQFNDHVLTPQLQSPIHKYQRQSFSALGTGRQNQIAKQSIVKQNLKNIGAIAPQKRYRQNTSLNHSFNHDFSSKHSQYIQKSRVLDRSRKLQNIGRQSSVRKELEEVSTNNNQDTLFKLKKIGQLNSRINDRIKKIIETFEQPPQY